MDDFKTLSSRLLNRCPAVGIVLSKQLINDSWRTLQSRREWSFRRRSNTFAPPDLYNTGTADSGDTFSNTPNPYIITGHSTNWTADMIGRQIRLVGLLFPFYTITAVLSPTKLQIDQPWAGPAVVGQSYTIQQLYFPTPQDFGYMYACVSIKDGFRLWTNTTEADLAILDPQRTNFGQTYAAVFKDYTSGNIGTVGPVQLANGLSPTPMTTTQTGFTYPIPLSYLITVTLGGSPGTAQFVWTRLGTNGSNGLVTSSEAQDLEFGVQVYWPDGAYFAGTTYFFQAFPGLGLGTPRFELWPGPTSSTYLYPYIYISKEYDLTDEYPQLPPFIANRGEVLLEMALEKCAEYPGSDSEHLNIYHDLRQAQYHGNKVRDMLIDLERNDEEVGVTNIDFQAYPYAPSPWQDGRWQQTHAPFLV